MRASKVYASQCRYREHDIRPNTCFGGDHINSKNQVPVFGHWESQGLKRDDIPQGARRFRKQWKFSHGVLRHLVKKLRCKMWPDGRSVKWGNRKWLSRPKVEEGKKELPGDWYSLFSFTFQPNTLHYSLQGLALRRAKEMDGVEVRVSLSAIFQEQGERTVYWLSQVQQQKQKGRSLLTTD